RHDRHAEERFEPHRPDLLAGERIEAIQRLRVPDRNLILAARRDERRRAIPLFARGQVLPLLLARLLVEGDGDAALTTDDANYEVLVDERMPAEAPRWDLRLVVLREVLRPDDFAIRGIEAVEIAHRAK